MSSDIERNFGEQPLAQILADHDLKAKDLVDISTEHLSFKMVSRACKGRRLTPNVKSKVRNALNKSTGKKYSMEEILHLPKNITHQEFFKLIPHSISSRHWDEKSIKSDRPGFTIIIYRSIKFKIERIIT